MAKRPSTRPAAQARRTVKSSFALDPQLLEDCRDAVVALSGPRLTLMQLVTEALHRELARLRKTKHGGRPFPKRAKADRLRVGRPIGS